MDDEYEILRHDAVRVSPRLILIFFLNNDLTDLDDSPTTNSSASLIYRPMIYEPLFPPKRELALTEQQFRLPQPLCSAGYLFLVHQLDS